MAAPHRPQPHRFPPHHPPFPRERRELPPRRTGTPRALPRGCRAPPAADKGTRRASGRAPLPPLLTFPPAGRPLPACQRARAPGGEGAPFCGAVRSGTPGGAARRAAEGEGRGGSQSGGARLGVCGGVCRADREVRVLTGLLSAGDGAEQQQERSPAERLHSSGRRRGAQRPR